MYFIRKDRRFNISGWYLKKSVYIHCEKIAFYFQDNFYLRQLNNVELCKTYSSIRILIGFSGLEKFCSKGRYLAERAAEILRQDEFQLCVTCLEQICL